MKKIVLVLMLVLFGHSAAPVHAGLFSSKKKDDEKKSSAQVQRRYVLNVPDKNTEKQLLDLLNGRKHIGGQISVLRGLLVEKQRVYRALEQKMEQSYGVNPRDRYFFDQPGKSIYELVPVATNAVVEKADAEKKSATPGFDRKLFREFADDDQVRQFAQMVRAKDQALDQVRVFAGTIREKESELGRMNERLASQFSLSKSGMYQYDADTMILYEIIPPPGTKPVKPSSPVANPATSNNAAVVR